MGRRVPAAPVRRGWRQAARVAPACAQQVPGSPVVAAAAPPAPVCSQTPRAWQRVPQGALPLPARARCWLPAPRLIRALMLPFTQVRVSHVCMAGVWWCFGRAPPLPPGDEGSGRGSHTWCTRAITCRACLLERGERLWTVREPAPLQVLFILLHKKFQERFPV